MKTTAHTFHNALRPGGTAILETQNVQGELRNVLEDALEQAGFYIPSKRSTRWLRTQLAQTGLPFAMILGQPFLLRHHPQYNGLGGEEQAVHDQARLRRFMPEYQRMREEDNLMDQQVQQQDTQRFAMVIYNTG